MKVISKLVLILLTIGLALGLSISSFILPEVKGENAPKKEFSAERAMQYVKKIAVKPHEIGSLEHEVVRDYLVKELTDLGFEPEIQKDLSTNIRGEKTVQGNIENISVRLKGSGDSKDAILLVAHYDSTSKGPGAADDTAGVATLLETIMALKESEPLKNDVIFLFSDGEENGLLGAKAFVDKNPLLEDTAMVMNFEARGNTGPIIMFETGNNSEWFMKEFKKSVSEPVAYSLIYEIYKNMPNDTDFTLFKKAGKEGFNFSSVMGAETYHKPSDTADNLNQRTLQHDGNYALSLVKHFGNLPLSNVEKGSSVYFTIAKSVFAEYSTNLVIPLAILAVALFIGTFIYGLKKEILSFGGIIEGFLLTAVSIVASACIGTIGLKVFVYILIGNKELSDDLINSVQPYEKGFMSVFIILAIGIMFTLYRFRYKKTSYENMICGNLLLMSIFTLASSFAMKSASYIFVWPTIFTLVGFMLQFVFKSQRNSEYKHLFLMMFNIITYIIIFAPIIIILYKAMGLSYAKIILGVLAIPLSNIILSSLVFFHGRNKTVNRFMFRNNLAAK